MANWIDIGRKRSTSGVFLFLLVLFACPITSADELLPHSVLVLDQSGPGMMNPGYAEVFKNFRATLNAKSKSQIAIYIENLDLDHFAEQRDARNLRNYLHEKYRDIPIGILVAVGSAALQFTLQQRSEYWPEAQIVFAAADEESVTKMMLSMDAQNVTGRSLKFSLTNSVSVARTLVPGLKSIALVGDPLERQAFRRHFKVELQELTRNLALIDLTGIPLAEVRKRVASLPEDSAILYTTIILEDGMGAARFLPNEALEVFADVANRPIVIDVDNRIGHGATGGSVMVPAEMGREAAQLVMRIFEGEKASQIPIAVSEANGLVFDWRQLQRWGISEAQLPAGSEIRFREVGIWEQHRMQSLAALFVLLFQTVLISWLIWEHKRRQDAELVASHTMSELIHMNRLATAGELSASIAHEVSQPLTGIVTRANAALRWLAADTPDVDKARTALSQIVRAGYRASDVITSVRGMFRKELHERAPVDVNKLILTVLRIMRIDLRKHNVELKVDLHQQLPPVKGDQVQLQQVILNLVMNAIEAMASAERRMLRLTSQLSKPDMLRVSIEDTGTGIDPPDFDRLFKPLFTTKARGMGMGLPICHSIIDSHDGRIWASAGAYSGSIFHFELPTSDLRN